MRVLVVGGGGFVGTPLVAALVAGGHDVVRGVRRPTAAAAPARPPPARGGPTTMRVDLDAAATLAPALEGCAAACYLVHGLGRGGRYDAWEAEAAGRFADAAAAAGVRRVAYLGGVVPRGVPPSRHLASRARTGEILRARAPGVVELRAAMIVGAGGASFRLARDLAARAPVVVRPPWLDTAMEPVALADVVAALAAALGGEVPSGIFGAPGPEALTGTALLQRLRALLGLPTTTLRVPLAPRRLVARALPWVVGVAPAIARELALGMGGDLRCHDPSVFARLPALRRTPFDEAAAAALDAEARRLGPAARAGEAALRTGLRVGGALLGRGPWGAR